MKLKIAAILIGGMVADVVFGVIALFIDPSLREVSRLARMTDDIGGDIFVFALCYCIYLYTRRTEASTRETER